MLSLSAGLLLSEGLRDQGPAASAGILQPYQPALAGLDVEHLKDGLNRQEPVTVTLGGLPLSKGGKGVPLSSFTAATKSLIRERYLYPNGSLIDFGYDVDGYHRVSIWNGPPRRKTSPREKRCMRCWMSGQGRWDLRIFR